MESSCAADRNWCPLISRRFIGPEVAKAIGIFPTYDGTLPEGLPDSFRERLQGNLTPEHLGVVDVYSERLRTSDVATVACWPSDGTVLMINDRPFRRAEGNQLMHGILRLRVGRDAGGSPIDLLSGRC